MDTCNICCEECWHYEDHFCKAYNNVVESPRLVYTMCPASKRIQAREDVDDQPSFLVKLGEEVALRPSSPKAKKKRSKKKKPALAG